MSGTRLGGKRAAATNRARHGKEYYQRIGHLGGLASTGSKKGFAANIELAKEAGRVGGLRSKRGKKHPKYKIYFKGKDAGYWKFKSEQEAIDFYVRTIAEATGQTRREILNEEWKSPRGPEKCVTFVEV